MTAPVFAYEEVDPEGVTEGVEDTTDETEIVDVASLSAEDRLAYLQKLADDNARLRQEAASLKTALAKAQTPGTTRARKDPERDARLLLGPVQAIMNEIQPSTTEKDPRPKYRYVGSVDVPNDGDNTTSRFHVTVVITPAKRG